MPWFYDLLWLFYDGIRLIVWPRCVTPDMVPRMVARDFARRKRRAISCFADRIVSAAKNGETSLVVRTHLWGDDTNDAVAEAFAQRGYHVETVTWAIGEGENRREGQSKVVSWGARCEGCEGCGDG